MQQGYNKVVITNSGMLLLNQCLTGEDILEFTRISTGTGMYSEEEKTEKSLKELVGLKEPVQSFPFSGREITEDDKILLKVVIANENITENYYINEIGIYAKSTLQDEEVLYAVVLAKDMGDYIPKYTGDNPIELIEYIYVYVSDSSKTTIKTDTGAFALTEDLDNHVKDLENPHQVTASQVPYRSSSGEHSVQSVLDSIQKISREEIDLILDGLAVEEDESELFNEQSPVLPEEIEEITQEDILDVLNH